MNAPPTSVVRVTVSDLRNLINGILGKLDVRAEDADSIGDLMVDTNLRGVFSQRRSRHSWKKSYLRCTGTLC